MVGFFLGRASSETYSCEQLRLMDGRSSIVKSQRVAFDRPGNYCVRIRYTAPTDHGDSITVTVEGGAPQEVSVWTGQITRDFSVVVLPPLKADRPHGPSANGFHCALSAVTKKSATTGTNLALTIRIAHEAKEARTFAGIDGGSWGGAWVVILDEKKRLYAHQRLLRREKIAPKTGKAAVIPAGKGVSKTFDLPIPLPSGEYGVIVGYSTVVDSSTSHELWSNFVRLKVD